MPVTFFEGFCCIGGYASTIPSFCMGFHRISGRCLTLGTASRVFVAFVGYCNNNHLLMPVTFFEGFCCIGGYASTIPSCCMGFHCISGRCLTLAIASRVFV